MRVLMLYLCMYRERERNKIHIQSDTQKLFIDIITFKGGLMLLKLKTKEIEPYHVSKNG